MALFELFLADFWRDVDAGGPRPIEHYLERYPAIAAEIRAEYGVLLRSLEDASAPASAGGARRIGRYQILDALAPGGMGLAYLGHDPELRRPVVLKTVKFHPTGNDRALLRLKREARIGSRLSHPWICPVLDVVHDGDQLFIVMPFVEGETLAKRVEDARAVRPALACLPLAEQPAESEAGAATSDDSGAVEPERRAPDLRRILRLMEGLCSAAQAMHEQGVVHRDIKPGNILLRPDGTAVLLDFGLALDSTSDSLRLTCEGDPVGTPLYMAPEQVEGRLKEIDSKTDVYALGVVLYELLTLRSPHDAKTKQATFRSILKGEPAPPSQLNPRIPPELEAVCLKAMASVPSERYARASELARDLRNVRTLQPTVARPIGGVGRLVRWARRRRTALFVGSALAAAIGLSTTLLVWNRTLRRENWVLEKLGCLIAGDELAPADSEALVQLGIVSSERLAGLAANRPEAMEEVRNEFRRRTTRSPAAGRLIQPRAAVSADRLVFELEPTDPAEPFDVRVYDMSSGEQFTFAGALAPAASSRTVRLTLPTERELVPGRTYAWGIQTSAGDAVGDFATFSVVDPRAVRRILELPSSGDGTSDRLARAALLIANELGAEARALLEPPLGEGATAEQRSYRALLQAQVANLLDDREAFDRAQSEYEAVRVR